MNTKVITGAIGALLASTMISCNNTNPLLEESTLFGGAPRFDKIKTEHYMPAFQEGIAQAKAEVDAIVNNPEEPTFENTIEALEFAGATLNRVQGIFYNLLEADTSEQLQQIAEDITPMMNDYAMYVSLSDALFARIKAVYEKRADLALEADQLKLLEDTYKGFARNGANLSAEDKEVYSALSEQLSLATLKFGKNVLAATNAYTLNITDEADLAGLPDYLVSAAAQTAKEKSLEGWAFDLSYPSYGPFMRFSEKRELRKQIYTAYNTRAVGGEFDNTAIVKEIVDLRTRIAQLLGYATYADYALEERMAKTPQNVNNFLRQLMDPSLPAARKDVETVLEFAKANGFDDNELKAWDWSFWSERYKAATYTLSESDLKPYLQLDNCIEAVLGLAGKLYGLKFTERPDLPVYHKDVKVFDVTDENGRHMALFYADFFPRASKRGGAWMTSFTDQYIKDGVEHRPLISIVTNFSKPIEGQKSALITHDELETFLHEFGHALHGMLAEGRYASMTGTSVSRDFVELPSQIMENWAYEPEYLQSFARHYETGEVMPDELIRKIVESKNYLAGYLQVRQLHFGIIDMAWHSQSSITPMGTVEFEKQVLAPYAVLPDVEGTCISTSITHLFSGGYAAGYYSYKWAEVLEADAFALFKERGIFNRDVAGSFRENILSKGSSADEAELYRNFRGHDPQPEALLRKLGISTK